MVFLHEIKSSVLGCRNGEDYMPQVRRDFLQLLGQVMLASHVCPPVVYEDVGKLQLKGLSEAMALTLEQLHRGIEAGPRAESYADALSRVVKDFWGYQRDLDKPEWMNDL